MPKAVTASDWLRKAQLPNAESGVVYSWTLRLLIPRIMSVGVGHDVPLADAIRWVLTAWLTTVVSLLLGAARSRQSVSICRDIVAVVWS